MDDRKTEVAVGGCFLLWFVIWGLLSAAGLGVAIWAVIKLVNHFAG